MRVDRLLVLGATTMLFLMMVAAASVWYPRLVAEFGDMITHFTLEKSQSQSSEQRQFWSLIGYRAFLESYGLGIGAGSFRSSSLITAIMGSMGVIGIVCFVSYLLQVFKPLRLSTYVSPADPRAAVGAAASWVCFASMVPAAVGSPTPDPGVLFAVFAGAALALRPAVSRKPQRIQAGPPSGQAAMHDTAMA
ncbi:hypothetical protein [Sphingomonas aerolata]|uniref:hypothetical protein n=2 Tax=Sphingomonadaceae TaxID=41297 RepID=UPI00141B84DE|nr:hypothetical protein [Sphingomonas aerolata]